MRPFLAALKRLARWLAAAGLALLAAFGWLGPRLWASIVTAARVPGRIIAWLRRHWQWVLTGLVMAFVMLLAAAITLRVALHVREVTVPDLAGLTVSEASESAVRAGVDLTIENRFYSTTVPAGRILSQAPAAALRVRHGWQVRVTESLGPQDITIPDVTGEQVRDAAMDLRRKLLDLGTQARIDAPGDADIVLAQTPPPDAGVDQPRVHLLLSSSAQTADSAFLMPSFVGLSYTGASRAALEDGLRAGAVWSPPAAALSPPSAPEGTSLSVATPAPSSPGGPVTAQSPAAGSRANRGDLVKLYFGNKVPAS